MRHDLETPTFYSDPHQCKPYLPSSPPLEKLQILIAFVGKALREAGPSVTHSPCEQAGGLTIHYRLLEFTHHTAPLSAQRT